MLRKILKLLVLLATIQFANASENIKQFEQLIKQCEQLNVNIKVENINIYKENQGNIFNNSNNDNNINVRCDIPSTRELQIPFYSHLNDIIQNVLQSK